MATFQEIIEWVKDNILAANAKVGLKISGFELSFSTEDIRQMIADRDAVRMILSRCFIQRRLFYSSYEKEGRGFVGKSVEEIVSVLREETDRLRGKGGTNAPIVRLLLQFESTAVHLRQSVQELTDDNWETLRNSLSVFRRDAIPLVDVLINLLPEDDAIRQEAEKLVAIAMSSLPGNYILSVADSWAHIPV